MATKKETAEEKAAAEMAAADPRHIPAEGVSPVYDVTADNRFDPALAGYEEPDFEAAIKDKTNLREVTPGGVYIVGGRKVNAHGQEID